MIMLDPISLSYGMVIGSVIVGIGYCIATMWEDLHGQQQAKGKKRRA